jgi:hypothetical protein
MQKWGNLWWNVSKKGETTRCSFMVMIWIKKITNDQHRVNYQARRVYNWAKLVSDINPKLATFGMLL